jgi:hypothetical protein
MCGECLQRAVDRNLQLQRQSSIDQLANQPPQCDLHIPRQSRNHRGEKTAFPRLLNGVKADIVERRAKKELEMASSGGMMELAENQSLGENAMPSIATDQAWKSLVEVAERSGSLNMASVALVNEVW